MRWKQKDYSPIPPKEGDEKLKTLFLWLPVTLKGETRWLCTATVKMKYGEGWFDDGNWGAARGVGWYFEEWA